MSEVSRLIEAAAGGDRKASADLLPFVYEELRQLAAARMANEAPDHTLNATALVHEAYLRLVDTADAAKWESRGHFFAAAAEAMRRILVENARRKKRLRHGGDLTRVPLEGVDESADIQRPGRPMGTKPGFDMGKPISIPYTPTILAAHPEIIFGF